MKKGYHFIVSGGEEKNFVKALKELKLEPDWVNTPNFAGIKQAHYIIYVTPEELLYINLAVKCELCFSV